MQFSFRELVYLASAPPGKERSRDKKIYLKLRNESTLGARDFSSAVSGFGLRPTPKIPTAREKNRSGTQGKTRVVIDKSLLSEKVAVVLTLC